MDSFPSFLAGCFSMLEILYGLAGFHPYRTRVRPSSIQQLLRFTYFPLRKDLPSAPRHLPETQALTLGGKWWSGTKLYHIGLWSNYVSRRLGKPPKDLQIQTLQNRKYNHWTKFLHRKQIIPTCVRSVPPPHPTLPRVSPGFLVLALMLPPATLSLPSLDHRRVYFPSSSTAGLLFSDRLVGVCNVTQKASNDSEEVLGQLKPPDVFGELNFLEGLPATAKVVAACDCDVRFPTPMRPKNWDPTG